MSQPRSLVRASCEPQFASCKLFLTYILAPLHSCASSQSGNLDWAGRRSGTYDGAQLLVHSFQGCLPPDLQVTSCVLRPFRSGLAAHPSPALHKQSAMSCCACMVPDRAASVSQFSTPHEMNQVQLLLIPFPCTEHSTLFTCLARRTLPVWHQYCIASVLHCIASVVSLA